MNKLCSPSRPVKDPSCYALKGISYLCSIVDYKPTLSLGMATIGEAQRFRAVLDVVKLRFRKLAQQRPCRLPHHISCCQWPFNAILTSRLLHRHLGVWTCQEGYLKVNRDPTSMSTRVRPSFRLNTVTKTDSEVSRIISYLPYFLWKNSSQGEPSPKRPCAPLRSLSRSARASLVFPSC